MHWQTCNKTSQFVHSLLAVCAFIALAFSCAFLPECAFADEDILPNQATDPEQKRVVVQDTQEPELLGTAAIGTIKSEGSDTSTKDSSAGQTIQDKVEDSNRILDDGRYVIEASVADNQVLDVSGGSSANGANVQTYAYNGTNAQLWDVAFDDDTNSYVISNVGSKKVLDASGGIASNCNNVWQYENNDTAAQRWILAANPNGSFRVLSAINKNYVLDVAGAGTTSGTNIWLYLANGTIAQNFWFLNLNGVSFDKKDTVVDGCYTVAALVNESKVLDVSAGSLNNSANIQIYASNGTGAQRFQFAKNSDDTYTIYNVKSGKVLDVSGGSLLSSANVQQYAANGTKAQKWVLLYDKGKDAYQIISCVSGMYLDILGGSSSDGSNIQVYHGNGTNAQFFKLIATNLLADGPYLISPDANVGLAIDIPGASTASGIQAQLYSINNTFAQKYQFIQGENDQFAIQSISSGLYLGVVDSNVKQFELNDNNAVWWTMAWTANGFSFQNTATGLWLTYKDAAKSGAKMIVNDMTKIPAFIFRVMDVPLISDGYYTFESCNSGKVLDVAGASRLSGANVQQWTSNGTNAQKFLVTALGDGWYRILNAATGKALDVAGASTKSGANVQMYKSNGTAAQQWKIELDDNGDFTLISKCSGLVVDILGGSKADGANVQMYTANDTKSQKFKLLVVAYTPDAAVALNVPVFNQYSAGLPTGCESCALTNALRYFGFSLADDEIADSYMPWSDWDFVDAFWGNPHNARSNSTMAPCIANTANSYLASHGSDLRATNYTGIGFDSLYSFIQQGSPVVIWATIGMGDPGYVYGYQQGYEIHSGSHTVVLAGYDFNTGDVLVSDTIDGIYWMDAGRLAWLYYQMGSQAVVIA